MNPLNHFKEFLTQAHCYVTLSIRLRIILPITLIARKPKKPYLACLHAALWACVLSLRSSRLCVTLRTLARQAPLSMGVSRQETAVGSVPSSRGSSWPRDWAHVSCSSGSGRRVLYHSGHPGSLHVALHALRASSAASSSHIFFV